MNRLVRLITGCLLAGIPAGQTFAQDVSPREAAPTVMMAHPSADRLFEDIEYGFRLTSEEEQKQLQNVKDYLNIFLIGVDRTRPFRMDALWGEEENRYRSFVPLSDFRVFRRQNLRDLGIESKQLFPGLYRLDMPAEGQRGTIGYMRIKHDYAIMSPDRGDIPLDVADPVPPIEDLIAGYDAALDIQNTESSAAALSVRRRSFDANTRPALMEGVKQAQDESDEDFELRKTFVETQLDELGRLYTEAEHARLGLVIDEKKETPAWMDLFLNPLPGTDLEASIQMLAQQPSHFANVERTDRAILSGRVNHPLDDLRKKNFTRLSQLVRRQAKDGVDEEQDFTDREKSDRKKALDLFFDILDAGIQSGVFDGFVEAHSNESGKNTIVGGILVPDGNRMTEVLELLPRKSAGQTLERNVEEVGDIKIHKFDTATRDDPLWNGFFGSSAFYVGTQKEAVWYAAGENALAELKAAIDKVGEPNTGAPDDPVVDLLIKLGPWMKLRAARHQGRDEPEDLVKLRQLAVEAFDLGDDKLTLRLERVEDRVEGLMAGQPGVVRFAAKVLADFSKENLEDAEE